MIENEFDSWDFHPCDLNALKTVKALLDKNDKEIQQLESENEALRVHTKNLIAEIDFRKNSELWIENEKLKKALSLAMEYVTDSSLYEDGVEKINKILEGEK